MNIYKEQYDKASEIYTQLEAEVNKEKLTLAYRHGMLCLKELNKGHTYLGKCRGATTAQWNGEYFVIARWEMTTWIFDYVPHPEEDEGHDIFVPVFDLTKHIDTQIFGE